MRRLISSIVLSVFFSISGGVDGDWHQVSRADPIPHIQWQREMSVVLATPDAGLRPGASTSVRERVRNRAPRRSMSMSVPERRPDAVPVNASWPLGIDLDEAARSVGWQAEQPMFRGGFVSKVDPALPPGARRAVVPVGSRARMSDVEDQIRCLALNIYWEARSESLKGKIAVAKVTLNRVKNPRFPDSICEVVRQGEANVLHRCQFSWFCDGRKDVPRNKKAWYQALGIAYVVVLHGPPDPTRGALWYHADYVDPTWSRTMTRTTQIGRHIYYVKG